MKFYKASAAAKEIGADTATIHRLINSGSLQAVDISTDPSKRRCWRISDESLQRFLKARSNRASASRKTTRPSLSALQPEDCGY